MTQKFVHKSGESPQIGYVKNFIYNIASIESKIEKYSYPQLSYSEYDIHIDNISEKFAQNDRKMSQGTENDKKF